jgi:hypothetical protein
MVLFGSRPTRSYVPDSRLRLERFQRGDIPRDVLDGGAMDVKSLVAQAQRLALDADTESARTRRTPQREPRDLLRVGSTLLFGKPANSMLRALISPSFMSD